MDCCHLVGEESCLHIVGYVIPVQRKTEVRAAQLQRIFPRNGSNCHCSGHYALHCRIFWKHAIIFQLIHPKDLNRNRSSVKIRNQNKMTGNRLKTIGPQSLLVGTYQVLCFQGDICTEFNELRSRLSFRCCYHLLLPGKVERHGK